jgi:hypothetical protein
MTSLDQLPEWPVMSRTDHGSLDTEGYNAELVEWLRARLELTTAYLSTIADDWAWPRRDEVGAVIAACREPKP